jgi:hypothetical protein
MDRYLSSTSETSLEAQAEAGDIPGGMSQAGIGLSGVCLSKSTWQAANAWRRP